MKYLLLLLAATVYISCYANHYYVASSGSDAATGLVGDPWQTITKVNTVSFVAGDIISFNGGDVFTGTLVIKTSGVSGNPITYNSYGTGKAIINGFTTISSWTDLGNGIYESASAIGSLADLNMVTIDGIEYAMGRYPNANAVNSGYITFQSATSTSVTSNTISGAPNFVGGEAVVRRNRFYIDRNVITAQTSTTVTYTAQSSSVPTSGFGFFFQNSLAALDQLGEWYYNPSTKKLDVFISTPSSYTIKASSVDTLLKSSSKSYITIDGISFQGANKAAIQVSGGSNFVVQNCDINFSGRDGIVVVGINNFSAISNSINWSNSLGINAWQGQVGNVYIHGNTVNHTGMFAGMAWKVASNATHVGIQVSPTATGSTVTNNIVLASGYSGMAILESDSTIVDNNYVDSCLFIKDDGGGIYTWVGSVNTEHTGFKIRNNVVLNGIGATAGSNSTTSDAEGIYCDANSNNIDIIGNTVAHFTHRGLFFEDARENIVRDNTFYDNAYQIYPKHDALGSPVTACTFRNNIMFAKTSTQLCSYMDGVDYTTIGTFDSNYYCRPIAENTSIRYLSTLYTLAGWQSLSGQDAHSKTTSQSVQDATKIRFEYNETASPKSVALGNSYTGVDGAIYSGTISIPAYSSLILLNPGAAVSIFYHDADGDGYGLETDTVQSVSAPSGYIPRSGDCDDTDAAINPAATEICDSKDNNCDGQVDEGCPVVSSSPLEANFTSNVYYAKARTNQATVTVSLSKAYSEYVYVNYTTSDGTAISGTDYRTTTGVIRFTPGVTSLSIQVELIKKRQFGSTKYFYVRMTGATNAVIGSTYITTVYITK